MATTSTRPEVPFFNYPHVFVSKEEQLLEVIKDVGRRGAFILQQDLERFERRLECYLHVGHALGVANGTDALILALRAAGIGEGDEVIFCSHTYVATAASIHYVGATPVPVECGTDHMIDTEAAAAAVTPRTRAIMPTQLNGRTCDMDAIASIAGRHDLVVVEDSAQALGAKFRGRCAGTFGAAGTVSFYPAKTLGCLGDGGAVFTNDDSLYDTMYQLRDHGRNQAGEMIGWGLNSRLDNLQAAILDVKLQDYDEDVRRRREIASLYQSQLGDVEELLLPPAPESEPDHFDVFQNYEIEAQQRDELQTFLKTHGIGTLVQWGGQAVHQIPGLGLSSYLLPATERMIARALMLPMNTSLTDDDAIYVADMIREFYAK
ncbi:MAG: cell wall biogenesis protein [Planctomycetaceae bacterium]|nr:cell wall biogenesis protein [Planctomycetaceae bacterium]